LAAPRPLNGKTLAGLDVPQPSKKKLKRHPEGSVCKPCWELKYCPYGQLVEFFPLLGGDSTAADREATHRRALKMLKTVKTDADAYQAIQFFLYSDPANWDAMADFEPEEISCRIWGHTCPVFFTQSGATETKVGRLDGRYIPRTVMLQVVRRDNHVCQECFSYVPDDQLEFDHVIPLSRGGSTSVENLRLLCRNCNNAKSDRIDSLLVER
jgi:hypothetical protein